MPSNQSLILAGEPLPGTALALLDGGTLRRVTVAEPRSASTLVVQADHQLQNGPLPVVSRGGRSSSGYLKPIELYSRTQRSLEEGPRAALLDVLA